jgi:hypothetical protein
MTKIKKLTDETRYQLADGNICNKLGTFELKKFSEKFVLGTPTLPAVPGGIFDFKIFGSPYPDRCACGGTKTQGKTCPFCQTHVNTYEEALKKIGLIKSPFYFITSVHLLALNQLINKAFKGGYVKLDIRNLYTKFFTYSESTDSLVISDEPSELVNPSYEMLSIEGLIKIFTEHKPQYLNELKEIVQKYIIVRPVIMRPCSYKYKTWLGHRRLDMAQINFQYESLIYLCYYLPQEVDFLRGTVEDVVYTIASIRLAITKIMDAVTDLILTSKASIIRSGYSIRVPDSARGVARADPELTIDQVSIPIAMCYEIFRPEFMDWLFVGFKLNEDEVSYKMVNRDKDMIELFKKFIAESDLYVMINRAPTLYKLSQLVFKVTVNEGSSIGYSLMATTPLNLDFDGDTIAVYKVPEHLKDKVQDMLPSKVGKYIKSDKEVIIPKQETLIGLMIASGQPRNDDSDRFKYIDFSHAEDDWKKGKFTSSDLITIGDKKTTYGLEKLETILGYRLDGPITSKNISDIVTKLKAEPDYVTRMKQLQDFGLEVNTYESTEDISLERLEKDAQKIDKTQYNGLDSVQIYAKQYELAKKVDPLTDSLKGNTIAISSIVSPQTAFNGRKFEITSGSMLGTITPSEYIRISTEFRKVQQVKNNSVGESGYLSRQIWTAMSKLSYNPMMTKPRKLLKIIPTHDGIRYQNCREIQVHKGEPVEVDSVIYNDGNLVYPNDLYKSMKFADGHLVGVDMGMQMSETVTQGILKLKHAGGYVSFSNYGLLESKGDCEIRHDSQYLYIDGMKFILSPKFKFVDPSKVKYKNGELVGINPTLISPNTNLYLLMKLTRAMGTTQVFAKPILYPELYATVKGTVSFDGDKVVIGGQRYQMPAESLCLVHEGQYVSPGDKLFTGALDYTKFVSKHSDLGLSVLFRVFANEYTSLVDINSILVEFLFKAIHSIVITDTGDEAIVFRGIRDSIDPSEDLLTSLTFGFIKNKLSKFLASDSDNLGNSPLINVAYQFNGITLGYMAQQDIAKIEDKMEDEKRLESK